MDALSTIDPFGARASLGAGPARPLPARRARTVGSAGTRLPVTVRILLENLLRHAGGGIVRPEDVETLAAWRPGAAAEAEIPFMPARVILQDFTGVPGGRRPRGHARRDGRPRRRPGQGQPARPGRPRHRPLRPGRPVRHAGARSRSTSSASTSATASATSSCAGRRPRSATCASCRPGRASSTRSTSSSWPRSSTTRDGVAFPDTLVGTDSHTTMVNGARRPGLRRRRHRGRGGPARPAALPADAPRRRRPPHRRAAARLHGDRPRPGRHRAAAQPRRRRRVRRVRRRRAGRPVARRPRDDQQHEPRVRGDVDALPDRRRDARLPAPDRAARRSGSRSSSATRRSRACGASRATARTSTSC